MGFLPVYGKDIDYLDVSAAFVMLDCELHPDKDNLLLQQPVGFKI